MGRFDELQRLFLEARVLEGPERERYLARIADASLRPEVQRLLEAAQSADETGFLDLPSRTPDRSPPQPGDRFGNYEILRELRAGGMGVVFLGYDDTRDCEVALKFLHPLLWAEPTAREQLLHEADIVGRLDHPGIVPLLDSREIDGWLVLAYRYIDGGSLTDEIERFHRKGRSGRWQEPEDAVRELLPVVEGLVHAHEQGIWHRDIKPSNILLEQEGTARITDFGLAKDSADGDLTRSGIFKGSVRYMSPEQARARLRLVDARSDVFSLGVVLFECLSGQHPFEGGPDEEILERIAHGEAARLTGPWPEAPESLTAICFKATRPEPDDRYPSMAALAADLRAAYSGAPTHARLPTRAGLLLKSIRRRRARVALGGMTAAIVALVAILLWVRPGELTTMVEVESTGVGHSVVVQAFDAGTGGYLPARSLGETPTRAKLPDGDYRLTVTAPTGEFAELDLEVRSTPEASSPVTIVATPAETDTTGMVRIPIGPFLAGYTGFEDSPFNPPHTAEIQRPYWMDATEVTNSRYAEFVTATGRAAPGYFEGADLAEIGELPVVGVTWEDATAYADWVGKRLPTSIEWERAARGTDGRLVAWGNLPADLSELGEGACLGRYQGKDFGNMTPDDIYLASVCQVGTSARDVSPAGLYDMTGNVSEWVSDRLVQWNDGVPVLMQADRLAKGLSWQSTLQAVHLGAVTTLPGQTPHYGIGFRCARSEFPATVGEGR